MSKSAKRTIGIILGTALIIAAVIAAVSYYTVLLPRSNYNAAAEAMAQEKYQDAHDMFVKLGDYQDAPKQADQAMYLLGCEYFEAFDFENARRAFQNTAYYDTAVKSKIISAYQSAAAADELLTSIPEHLTGDEIPLPHGVFAYKSTVYKDPANSEKEITYYKLFKCGENPWEITGEYQYFYHHEDAGFITFNGYVINCNTGEMAYYPYDIVTSPSEGRFIIGNYGENAGYGIMDYEGNVIIKPEYDSINGYSNGLAAASKDGKSGYLDLDGNVAIEFRFDSAGTFHEGLAKVKMSSGYAEKDGIYTEVPGGFGLIDSEGNTVVEPVWKGMDWTDSTAAAASKYGLIRVQDYSGLYGFVSLEGETVTAPAWQAIDWDAQTDHESGIIRARGENGLYGLIAYDGSVILKPHYSTIDTFSEGLAYAAVVGTKATSSDAPKANIESGYINKAGEMVIDLVAMGYEYATGKPFNGGAALIIDNADKTSRAGCINASGRILLPITYQYDEWRKSDLSANGNVFIVKKGDTSVYYRAENGVLNEFTWDYYNANTGEYFKKTEPTPFMAQWSDVGDFNEDGIAVARLNGYGDHYAFIRNDETTLTPPKYQDALNFSHGLAAVKENGLWGYIDMTGNYVIELQYSRASCFVDDIAVVSDKDGDGLIINRENEIVASGFRYANCLADNAVTDTDNGLMESRHCVFLRINGKWQVYDTFGNRLL